MFPHEYRRAMAEATAIKKAEEEQKAAIKAAGGPWWLGLTPYLQQLRETWDGNKSSTIEMVCLRASA